MVKKKSKAVKKKSKAVMKKIRNEPPEYQQVEKNIFLHDSGYFFADECEQLNGPFEDLEICKSTFEDYCKNL